MGISGKGIHTTVYCALACGHVCVRARVGGGVRVCVVVVSVRVCGHS